MQSPHVNDRNGVPHHRDDRHTHLSGFVPMLGAVIVLVAVAVLFAGCAPRQGPDWHQAHDLLAEADETVEAYQAVLEDEDRRERLERVRNLNASVLAAVEARMLGDDAGDPTPLVRELVATAGLAIDHWPDPRQRAIAQLTYRGLRLGLMAAGVDLHGPIEPRPRDDAVDGVVRD